MSQSPTKLAFSETQQQTNNQTKNQSKIQMLPISPTIIKVSSQRRKRKYLQNENIIAQDENLNQLSSKSKMLTFEQQDQQNEDNTRNTAQFDKESKSDDSEKSKSSSNKQTKPGKTIEEPYEQQQSQNYKKIPCFEFQLTETRRIHEQKYQQQQICEKNSKNQQQQQYTDSSYQEEYDEEQDIEVYKLQRPNIKNQKDMFHPQTKLNKLSVIKQQPEQKVQIKPIYKKININQSIKQSIPKGFKLTCFIRVQNKLFGMGCIYHLCINDRKAETFISAKKQLISFSPNYIISKSQVNHSKRDSSYIGSLSGNFGGTEWNFSQKSGEQNKQRLFCKYNTSLFGSSSIRSMQAYKLEPNIWKNKSLMRTITSKHKKGLIKMQTAIPKLQKGRHKIDFRGIAKVASNKNFILNYSDEGKQKQCLLFAKQSQSIYQVQISYPLSISQGLALCLTSLDGKILVN